MTAGPRRTSALSRRHLLALAAGAALPACAGEQAPTQDRPPTAPPTAPPVTPAESAAPDGRASAAPAAVTGGGGPVPFTPGRVRLGAYVDLRGKSLRESRALRRRQLGRDQAIVHRFLRWRDDLPRTAADDGTLLISWRGAAYDSITDGSADWLVAAAARRLARRGDPVLLRWGWDMNRDFYAWGGADNGRDTGGYVAAWRRLHRIFAAEGADNVSWVWSPHWRSRPDAGWNEPARYYPGDDYVDWVGVSGYNVGGESPALLFDDIYTQYAHRKPIIIAEVAAVDRGGRTKADWIGEFADWVTTRPAVGAVVWFDTDTHPDSDEQWRIDSDEQALAAYRAMADDPAFGG